MFGIFPFPSHLSTIYISVMLFRTERLVGGCIIVLIRAVRVHGAANLTSLVNLFIGTASGANGGSGGNVFPGMNFRHYIGGKMKYCIGAAIPHGMAKVS